MNSGTLVGQSLDKNMFNHPGHLSTEDASPPPRDQVWVTRPEAKPATTLRAWRHRKCAHSPFISLTCVRHENPRLTLPCTYHHASFVAVSPVHNVRISVCFPPHNIRVASKNFRQVMCKAILLNESVCESIHFVKFSEPHSFEWNAGRINLYIFFLWYV